MSGRLAYGGQLAKSNGALRSVISCAWLNDCNVDSTTSQISEADAPWRGRDCATAYLGHLYRLRGLLTWGLRVPAGGSRRWVQCGEALGLFVPPGRSRAACRYVQEANRYRARLEGVGTWANSATSIAWSGRPTFLDASGGASRSNSHKYSTHLWTKDADRKI